MNEISKIRWQRLAGILTERTSPEAMQDLEAYYGTNDSVDGPYKIVADEQPMGVDKSVNKELVEQKLDVSPESMNPSREDEEEAMAKHQSGKYPATAEEYAKQLNAKSNGPFSLMTEPEAWAKYDVHTGEDLAKYLMASEIWDLYKEMYGIRPRFMDPFKMSIEELEKRLESLRTEWEEMQEEDQMDIYDYEAKEEYEDHPRELEYDVGPGKYEDLEADWDEKLYGKR